MDFGLALTFGNPKHRYIAPARLWESQIRQVELAERLGYDHIWIPSHHGDEYYFPNPFPLLAAMAMRTERIRLGTYIVVLPQLNPLIVAEDAVTVDVISNGRLDLGLGLGNFVDEFKLFGVPRQERAGRMEEGREIVTGLWTQETFSYEGKYYRIPPFRLTPRPVQKAPPLWVAATVDKAFERAARFGAHLAGNGHGFDIYDRHLRTHGRDPKHFNRAILEMVYLADDEDTAWLQFGPYVLDLLRNYQVELDKHGELTHFRNQPGGYFGVDPLPEAHDLEKLKQLHFLGSPFIVGTPDIVPREIARIEAIGVTHMVMQMQFAGMDLRLVEHSMRLFAEAVIRKR